MPISTIILVNYSSVVSGVSEYKLKGSLTSGSILLPAQALNPQRLIICCISSSCFKRWKMCSGAKIHSESFVFLMSV